MTLLWIAFFVLAALFAAAVVAKIVRSIGRGGQSPARTERPWR
ncbi:hypothetical protein [Ramlibacter agri]|nr:hypothetical protein [Ramlibacter agri]